MGRSKHAVSERSGPTWLVAAFVLLIAFRVAAICLSPLGLGPDEAQYWRWSTEPAWGYYSKPPLIAWVIGATTGLFGDSEWAIRLAAPLLHGLTALFLFSLGRQMYGPRVAIWAAACYLTMPGATYSSGVITTDAVLLPCFAAAMVCLWHLRQSGPSAFGALGLGIALGVGFLAKYAMVYAVIGLACAALIDRDTRLAVRSRYGLLAASVAAALVTPHLVWNAQNGFQTVNHTADNANWGGSLFSPMNGVQFLVDQMAIIGPIGFIALIAAIILHARQGQRDENSAKISWLLCFLLPALTLITVQAVVSRAHANWAATIYIAGCLILAATLSRDKCIPKPAWFFCAGLILAAAMVTPDLSSAEKLIMGGAFGTIILAAGLISSWKTSGILAGGVALNLFLAVLFTAIAIGPVSWSERFGVDQSFKRSRAWPETVARLNAELIQTRADVLLVDERELWHGVDYYGRGRVQVPVYSWRPAEVPKSFAEKADLADLDDPRVLVASIKPHQRPKMRADFAEFKDAGDVKVPIGGGAYRSIRLYEARGYDPLNRTPTWRERFKGLSEP
ncbi:MAG: glycosyltransferase family 39 protein [Pseudomonadota bacterium]